MKLRVIIIILALMAFLSATTGGYLYYSSIRQSVVEEARRQAVFHTKTIKGHLSFFLQENLNSVIALAGLIDLADALSGGDHAAMAAANRVLDHFNATFKADTCYLINRDGLTIASSNRHDPDSFVGHNYAFRPYFQQAITGDPDASLTYMALGVTSNKRGIYYSHPVYVEGQNIPAGVAVIKAPIESMERELVKDYEGIVMVTDIHGIVFISNHDDWILKSLTELSFETRSQLKQNRQFGDGPWDWTGLNVIDGAYATDAAGTEYLFHKLALENYPGWHLIFLSDTDAILARVYGPLIRSSGYLILALCTITGLIIFVLTNRANREINQRNRAEAALRRAHHNLEKRVADRTSELTRSVEKLRREITERHRAEAALRASEEKHRTLTENLSVGIFRSTPGPKGRYIDVNSAYLRMFGFENKDDLLSLHAYDLYQNPLDRDKFSKKMLRDGGVKNEEIVFKRRDGTLFYGSATAVAVKDKDGRVSHYDGILEDITELRHAKEEARERREEMAHLGRVAIMGELSASLAHELNQPLTAILSNAQAALRFIERDHVDINEIRDILMDIVADDRRAGNVIQRLRSLFRKGEIQKMAVDINQLIRDVIILVTTETMIRNVSIETMLAQHIEPVRGDKIHLQQVMINFILNASDAMSDAANGQRKIIISTRRGDAGMIDVRIRDCGSGVAEGIMDRIMEPFYTTKAEGMGMGLSINRTIIQAHGGQMWAANNSDGGATFTCSLPVHKDI